ncbi:Serine/threonine-protein kinase atg1 [Fusarium oxysporum f. sp. albedinis]|nr:Serine/threonine-protein kinase atg1 [Fusarium oxysporum f. sp. albedinis]
MAMAAVETAFQALGARGCARDSPFIPTFLLSVQGCLHLSACRNLLAVAGEQGYRSRVQRRIHGAEPRP